MPRGRRGLATSRMTRADARLISGRRARACTGLGSVRPPWRRERANWACAEFCMMSGHAIKCEEPQRGCFKMQRPGLSASPKYTDGARLTTVRAERAPNALQGGAREGADSLQGRKPQSSSGPISCEPAPRPVRRRRRAPKPGSRPLPLSPPFPHPPPAPVADGPAETRKDNNSGDGKTRSESPHTLPKPTARSGSGSDAKKAESAMCLLALFAEGRPMQPGLR